MASKAKTELAEILERVEGVGAHRVEAEALTFDDVLLKPAKAEIHPSEAEISSLFSRNITLNVPICSAAMDTVTESELAIALAREGGIGVLHRNLSIGDQAAMVDRVKRSESGMIVDPVTVEPETPVYKALEIMSRFSISGVPVVKLGRLVGILTNRDLRFEDNLGRQVGEVMTSKGLITAAVGTTLEEAQAILHEHRIEKLPVVDSNFNLQGLITVKDIQKRAKHPNACKDHLGRLRVAAAVGAAGDYLERATELARAGADAIVIDSAHGHSKNVMDAAQHLRELLSDRDLVVGNVATSEGAADLASLGVDAVKVGMGPGSTCTTRVVSGAGMPQMTAIFQAVSVCEPKGIPVIADGGIRYSGDVVKALAAGAHSVMIGSLFAGTTESPGEQILLEGRAYKVYRGMGSLGALRGSSSADRYFQEGVRELRKLVAEGIEGRVPYKGPLDDSVFQLVGGLRAGMGYSGAKSIEELRKSTCFIRVTGAGLSENHPHNISITREAPNYEVR
jgi:IMP dehydrogenase